MTVTLDTSVDPHRAAVRVPLVVLPGIKYRPMPWRRPASAAQPAVEALATLDRLIAVAGESDMRLLRQRLPEGIDALGRLAKALADAGGAIRTDDIQPAKLIYSYFGLRHSDAMPKTSMALYAVLVARWTLAELEFAAVDGNLILAELLAFRTIVSGLAEHAVTDHDVAPNGVDTVPLLDYLPDGDPFERWIVAHHAYLLLNVLAGGSVEAAIDCHAVGFHERAADYLRIAAVQTRGFTAAMLHSAVLPGRLYLDVVRPTMAPPHLPEGLTGGAFIEHRLHHRRIKELLAAISKPFAELAICLPDLALARDELLEADLVDIEWHTVMGEQSIHKERSLVQTKPDNNATAMLRKMRKRRVELYRPYMQFGAVQA